MKKTKILIVIISLILLASTLLVHWQYNNIKAVYYSYIYSNDDINGMIEKHYGDINKYLEQNSEYNVRPSTQLEQKLHKEKVITDDEFIGILTGQTDVEQLLGVEVSLNEKEEFILPDGTGITKEEIIASKDNANVSKPDDSSVKGTTTTEQSGKPSGTDKPGITDKTSVTDKPDGTDKPSGADKPNGTDKPTTTNKPATSNEKVSQCIARMYVLKSSFESQLDAIYVEAKAHYVALTPEERKNSKSELVKTFYGRATSLEATCDAQVNAVLSELEAELKATGQSTELVSKIQTAYTEEKSLKKAYYLNLYKS